MRKLFDIAEDLLCLDALLNEIEGDVSRMGEAEPVLVAWIDGLAIEEGKKLDGYVNWIKQLEMEATAAHAEADQFAAKAKARDERAKWLKNRLKMYLEVTGRTEALTDSGRTVAVQKNGGKVPIEFNEGIDIDWVEPRFIKTTKSIDTDEVRRALEAGEELELAKFGKFGTNLRIR